MKTGPPFAEHTASRGYSVRSSAPELSALLGERRAPRARGGAAHRAVLAEPSRGRRKRPFARSASADSSRLFTEVGQPPSGWSPAVAAPGPGSQPGPGRGVPASSTRARECPKAYVPREGRGPGTQKGPREYWLFAPSQRFFSATSLGIPLSSPWRQDKLSGKGMESGALARC